MMVEFSKYSISVIAALTIAPFMLIAAEYSLDECQSKAAEGNAEAQWQLGQRYENGDGVKKNSVRALAQYKKAAEQKHKKACAKLADLYENGKLLKKDPILSAKYRAWAEGENGELAAAQARTSAASASGDEIETALDYILGRNGKPKDPKTGIRILYQSAKDKPVAQRVFVERWSKGDLDDALSVLSNDEWEKLIPWFENAWDNGIKCAGQILGNDAYSKKQYSAALRYWQGSGTAKCWYFVGRFYLRWSEEGKGGGPSDMKDETKARKAYEKCLRIDSSWDDARFDLGCLYLFARNKENENLAEAKKIFSYFLKKDANDKWHNYNYGLAGYCALEKDFDKRWPKTKRASLIEWSKHHLPKYREGRVSNDARLKDYNNYVLEWRSLQQSQREYVSYIRKAADLGCEPAQKFISTFDSENQ